MEEPEERHFDLQKYQQPRISPRYVIRIVIYVILLISIIWITTSRLRRKQTAQPQKREIPVQMERAPEQGGN